VQKIGLEYSDTYSISQSTEGMIHTPIFGIILCTPLVIFGFKWIAVGGYKICIYSYCSGQGEYGSVAKNHDIEAKI
jgi:hypothetical protein